MRYLANNLLQQAEIAEQQRQQMMAKALAYYDGDEPQNILVVKPGDPDDNMAINYAQMIVRKGRSFLFGQPLGIGVGSETDTTGEAQLDKLWPAQARQRDLLELATNGGVCGHAWAKIALYAGRPEVVVLDPLNMSARWESDNYKRVTQYINQYNTFDQHNKPVIRRERTELQANGFWVIYYEESRPEAQIWTQFAPPVSWNYSFAPVFHCQNLISANEFYGQADLHKSVLSLIYYIARIDSLINRIVRVHAYPKPVATGIQKTDLQVGVDQVLFIPQKEARLELLEVTGDLAGAREFRKQLREALAEIAHVPEIATGKLDNIGQLSGLALKILYGPLIDQTNDKRVTYGPLIEGICQALLELSGRKNETILLHWPNPLPQDEKLDAEAKLAKKQVGVSQDSLLRELGYNPGHEAEMRKSEETALGNNLLNAFEQGQNNE